MPAIRTHEAQRAADAFDRETVLVHEAMMLAAQKREVGERSLAAICPVHDVVRVGVARVRAAGKAAPTIAGVQRAAHGRRNDPRLARRTTRRAGIVLDERDQTALATQAAHGCRWHRDGLFQVALTLSLRLAQDALVDVNRHHVSIRGG